MLHQLGKPSNKERPQKYILQEGISICIHIVSEAQGKKFDKSQFIREEGECSMCEKHEIMAFRYTVDEKSYGARWHPLLSEECVGM